MATPAAPQQAARARTPQLLRYIAIALLALIVLLAITVLITWLIIKPKRFVYSAEDGWIHNFNLTRDHLNAKFDFTIRSYNPNSRVSVYYDSIEVSAKFDEQTIAFKGIDPFFQPHRNVSRLEVKLTAQNVSLLGSTRGDLWLEKSSGGIQLDVLLKAKIRFKVGSWKSRHRTLRIWCSPVLLHFSRSKNFERTNCDVEL